MNIATATPQDFRRMWSIWRASQQLDQLWAYDNPDRREARLKALILGRLDGIGGGFLRVVMGFETLMPHVCDQSCDVLTLKPVVALAGESADLLREVSGCFTRTDDLPDELIPRIDAHLERLNGGA